MTLKPNIVPQREALARPAFRLNTGTAPFCILRMHPASHTATVQYLRAPDGSCGVTRHPVSLIEPWDGPLPNDLPNFINEQEPTMASKLYSFVENGAEVFCTKLAQNSEGQPVVEVKGTGAVRVAPGPLKGVLPPAVKCVPAHEPDAPPFFRTVTVEQKALLAPGQLIYSPDDSYIRVVDIIEATATRPLTGWIISANSL